jgi:HK97 family phage major capsid protein
MPPTTLKTRFEKQLPAKLPMQHRAFDLRAEAPAEGADQTLVAISFSSSNPVKRMSWGGLWWYEVLKHSGEAVKTDRLSQGISVLVNHDINQRAGILQDGQITDKKGSGNVRFNSTQFGKDTATEVREGTLPFISVGYIVHSESRVADIDPTDDEDENYLGTYEADSWEPVEVSFVAIPADPSVGVGRDLSTVPQYPVRFAGLPATPPVTPEPIQERHMPPEIEVGADNMKKERERTAGIALLARQYPDIVTREVADKAIGEGTERDTVAAMVLNKQRELNPALQSGSPVVLSDKERGQYSFLRIMRSISAPAGTKAEEAGLEREISNTIAKTLGRDTGGIFIPTNEPVFRLTEAERRLRAVTAGSPGSTTGGGATVATELGTFLDILRPALRLTKLGADFLGGCTGNFALPKMTGDVGFNWVGENPGVDNADVDPTFAQVPFSPLGATASTSWSRQLMQQSSIDLEAKLRNALVAQAAIGIEKAALNVGGSAVPVGVLGTTGVHNIAIGTNGGQISKSTCVDMLTAIQVANADMQGDAKYLFTPENAGYLAKTPELSNTIALPTFTYGQDGKGRVNGHDAYWSNLLPKTLTKGTASGTCHATIAAYWGWLTIAEWGAMEIIVDPYTKARQQLINIIANFLVDVGVLYPQAFSVNLDGIPQ